MLNLDPLSDKNLFRFDHITTSLYHLNLISRLILTFFIIIFMLSIGVGVKYKTNNTTYSRIIT